MIKFLNKSDSDPRGYIIDSDARDAMRLRRMRSNLLRAHNLHKQAVEASGERGDWRMITLTYRPDVNPAPTDISVFIRRLRYHYKKLGLKMRYIWVCELHKSGRPHYHVMIWRPRGFLIRKPDSSGLWSHGLSQVSKAVKFGGAYLAKYISKTVPHKGEMVGLPKGTRMHGNGGHSLESRLILRWHNAPAWLRKNVERGKFFRRLHDCFVTDTGLLLFSPYMPLWDHERRELRIYPRPFAFGTLLD